MGMTIERIFNFKCDKFWNYSIKLWIKSMEDIILTGKTFDATRRQKKKEKAPPEDNKHFFDWAHSYTIAYTNIKQLADNPKFGPIFPAWLNRFVHHDHKKIHWFVDFNALDKNAKKCLAGIKHEVTFDKDGYPQAKGANRFRSIWYHTPCAIINNDNIIGNELLNVHTILDYMFLCTLSDKSTMFSKMYTWFQTLHRWVVFGNEAHEEWLDFTS